LIKTVEKLEKAYVNSAVPSAEYESACGELITKYKTLRNTLSDTVPDVSHFMATYAMHCASARHRLQVGLPATIEHRVNNPSDRSSSSAVSVAECVHHYIGAMDTIKLNMVAKDQVAPCLSDLLVSLYKVPQLPADFKGKAVAQQWLERLEKMRASDELGDDEVRQLLFDVENSYNAFMQLRGGKDAGG
jgi:ESCRT-I complex subunit VPS28